MNIPTLSDVLEATFAATSSSGVCASAGRRAFWVGRTSAPAPATTAAQTNRTAGGPPTARTNAAMPAPAARRALSPTRTRSCGTRSGTTARMAARKAGPIRTSPRTPTPSGPAAW
jgi:hypothetical protein